jgi:hypothetical protein
MTTERPDDVPPERDPEDRPRRRRRDDDDFDDRPRRKSGNSTSLILILLGVGAFVVVSGGCLIVVCIAAITALGSNANSTFSAVASQVKYQPLKSDVNRTQFEFDLFGKSPAEVTAMLGTPSMKKKDPANAKSEWWYYTGANPQTGLPTKLPNTANGALVRVRFLNEVLLEVEWEPKQ